MTKQASLLSHAEYGRSRKARGLSGGTQQAVSKAVRQGRITGFGPEKLIDPVLADAQWERNTRARVPTGAPGPDAEHQGGAEGSTRPDLPELAAAAGAPTPDAPPQQLHGDQGYLKSRATQAEADARIAQMKAAELEGQLVRIDQVRAQLATQLAPVREALLQLPARMASLLAEQTDPGRVQTMLEAEIHQALAPLMRGTQTENGQAASPT